MRVRQWLRRVVGVSASEREAWQRIEDLCLERDKLTLRVRQLEKLYDDCEAQRVRELEDISEAFGRPRRPDGHAPHAFTLVAIARHIWVSFVKRPTTTETAKPTHLRVVRNDKEEDTQP